MIQVNRIYLIFNRLVTKKFLVDTSVLKGLNNYIVQIACSVTGLLNVFIRTRTELAWSEWKSVNIT